MLAYLVVHHDRVVSKQELLAQLWPNQVIGEDGLKAYILAVRQALGERGTAPRLVQTVRGRGYRLVAPVTVEGSAGAPLLTPSPEVAPEMVDAPGHLVRPQVVLEVAAPARVSPVGEEAYKQASVLCGALPKARALGAGLDPETYYRLLHVVSQVLHEVMQRYEGTLIQETSEGWTAVFGVPVAQEDHARRAVLAALELQQRLHAQGSLRVPMGVHSGLVVVGRLGEDTHPISTVVGSPVPFARRLQEQAVPGTLLLSAATYHLVQADVQAEPWGSLILEGLSDPLPVYAAQEIRPRRAGVPQRVTPVQSPFVGRQRELALLHDRLEAVRAGEGQVVSLVGPPGIGKTRLLMEFGRALAPTQVTWGLGQCLPYGQTTPYLPVRDLIQHLWALSTSDALATRTAVVRQQLAALGAVAEEDVALLCQLLDLPVASTLLARWTPEAQQARTLALLEHLLRHAAQRQPLVLALENVHWIDPTSAAWLTWLSERLVGMAVLLLVTQRPDSPSPWGTHAIVTQLALPPLRTEDSQAIIAAVPGTARLPVARRQQILAHGAGNPFFLEELAWDAVEHVQATSPVPIPETVHAVLAARLNRLPATAKALLQRTAVLGPEVPLPLLQAIAAQPEATVQQGLAHLQAAQVLYETCLLPERIYTFKHALIQEVAYGSLLMEQRRTLHGRVVEALEALAGEHTGELVERLSYHALHGEVWDKALLYCRQAGEKAMARSAYREAVAAFEQALGALSHLPESRAMEELAIDLRLAMDEALWRLGDWGRVLASLREAEALAERLGDQRRLAHVSMEMADGCRILSDYASALRAGQRALSLALALGDRALQIDASLQLGLISYHRGDYRQTIAALRQTITPLACQHHRPDRPDAPVVWPSSWLLVCLSQIGAFAEGHAMCAEVLRLAEALEHPFSLAVATFGVGQLLLRQGDLWQALAVCERGLAVCQRHDLHDWYPTLAARVGYVYALTGRLPEALTLIEQAAGQRKVLRGGALPAASVIWLGEAYLLAGRLDEASTQAQRALEFSRVHQEQGNEALYL